jgi:Zn finger protein HypA/HybF involved in hydrogenase expression
VTRAIFNFDIFSEAFHFSTMPEITAQKKFACPSCGAEAQWNASKQALVCPFCGTVSPATLDATTGQIEEHDLVAALRSIPDDQRGWNAEKVSVKCQSCQAITVFDAARVGQRCDFCGSSSLIPFEQIKAPIRPESLLAFKIDEHKVRESIRAWYRSRWFAPNALGSSALTDTVKGFYLPYWTFDAQAHADWTADSGYYYYTTETYRDSEGREQTRQVQHTRWVPSSGALDHFFDDELVAASRGVDDALLEKIAPFPTKELVKYDPGFLSGWVVEQYQIDLIAAAQRARERMDRELQTLCAQQVPGDTQRNLQVESDYQNQTFKHVLLPVWLLVYTFGTQHFHVAVNGVTGQIAGKYPLSWIKITLAVLAVLIVILIVALVASSRH